MVESNNLVKNKNNMDKKILLPLMFLPCLLVSRILDNDIWFLLNSGRYVMNFGIPHAEPFTIHANMEFVMQQWLTSVIYWITYNNFGESGLFLLIMICYGIIIFIMYKITTLISNNNFFVSFAVTMIFAVFIKVFIVTRPIVFAILLLMLELYSLEAFIAYKNNKYHILLPIISLLLINLQAAMWPMLFIMIVPYIIDSFKFKIKVVSGQGYEKKYMFITIILMILIAYINPYGIESMTYLFRSYGYPEISDTVLEMQPPNINGFSGIIIFSLIFIVIITYIFYRKGKNKIRYFLLTLGTGIMVLSSARNFSFFIICALFPLANYLKNMNFVNNNVTSLKMLMLRRILIAAILLVTLYAFFIYNNDKDEKTKFKDLNCAVDYILENIDITKVILYTGYNDGGFTEFKGLLSYIDPRAEVFVKKNNKKDDIMKEYIDLQYGDIYYKTVLNKYNFTYLIVSDSDILSTYLPHDSDYEIIYSNENYQIFKTKN